MAARSRRCLRAGITLWTALGAGVAQVPGSPAPSPDQSPASLAGPSNDDPGEVQRLIRIGRYVEAERLARTILQRTSPEGRPESPEGAEALRLLVDALLRQGKEKEPETRKLAEQSVAVSAQVFGEASPSYAASVGNLGTLRYRSDDFDGAREAFRRSMSIYKDALGPSSQEVALMLNKMAVVEGTTGHFEETRSLMEQAVATVDSLPVIDNPDMGSIVQNYGMYLERAGDLLGVEKADLRALEIRQRTLPTPHALIASSLMSVGYIREQLGDYASARSYLEQALAMTEGTLGPDHHQIAEILSDLARLSIDTGRPDLAVPNQERAVSIVRATRGEDNSEYWQYVSDLGRCRSRAGDGRGALELLREALAGQERKFGPVHQEVAATLLRLAEVEAETGDASSASEHNRRAIDIYRQMFGPAHPGIAQGLDALAHLRLAAGDTEGAAELLRQALDLRETALGGRHPGVAEVLVELAGIDWSRGDGTAGLQKSLRAEAILNDHFGSAIRGLSQSEALAYQRIRASGLGVAFSVLAGTPPDRRLRSDVETIWDAVIRSRALVLDQMASRHQYASEHRTGRAADLARELAAAANRLASVVVKGPDPANAQAYRARFEKALAEKEKLEHEMADAVGAAGGSLDPGEASLSRIRSALPPGTGMAAFVRFPKSPDAADTYGLLVLRKDPPAPEFIELGGAEAIDSLIDRWRREMVPPSGRSSAASSDETNSRLAGTRLRQKIWDPLERKVAGLDHVVIVPEGRIALVNFAALPVGKQHYLIERAPVLHYLSTERDVLRAPGAAGERNRRLLMGGPDFDASPPVAAAPLGPGALAAETTVSPTGDGPSYRGSTPTCDDFSSLRFGALPGAANEVLQLEKEVLAGRMSGPGGSPGFVRFTGADASEPSFKRWAPGSNLLHIATHGFFLGTGCGDAPAGGRGAVPGTAPHDDSRRDGTLLGNPLLLSGLALAGANRRARAGPDADDGILTSEEIASLDLSRARWVVLSACQTGVGEVQSGEGVLGLRRAFQLAGARTIIMGLWDVDDEATFDWMRRLYEARADGRSTADAVHQATLSELRERREKGESTHPFYWGAFVAAGDWR